MLAALPLTVTTARTDWCNLVEGAREYNNEGESEYEGHDEKAEHIPIHLPGVER
jgi:hypothetical protein